MRLPAFDYIEPKTLKEASKRLASNKDALLLAGGTDLLVNMKHRVIMPKQIIYLKALPKLQYITSSKEGLKIGTLTTLHEIATSPIVQGGWNVIAQAAHEVGAYAHQSMGTLGGNLCQENRCRFFNQSPFWRGVRPLCLKAGGKVCYVVPKGNKCYSTYCGDMAPVLIALGAQIKIEGMEGERALPLKKLYTCNGKKPLALKKGEILKEVFVPPASGKALYLKWRLRESLEFPIVSLALYAEKDQKGQIKKVRIVYSGVGSGPVEAVLAEKLLNKGPINEQVIQKATDQAVKEISPMRTSIYSPAYKRKMAGILLKEALKRIVS